MGSNVPWYESMCVARGAAECVTVEYNSLSYDHERMHTYTVDEFAAKVRAATRVAEFVHGIGAKHAHTRINGHHFRW
jgi:hypothetical protein